MSVLDYVGEALPLRAEDKDTIKDVNGVLKYI
jgi:hypothetical protein